MKLAEFLLDQPRIDPLAKDVTGAHPLLLALERGAPMDQGLPILELFLRKAPGALDLSGYRGEVVR